MIPTVELTLEKWYLDQNGLTIGIQVSEKGWCVLWADHGSDSKKEFPGSDEDRLNDAVKYVESKGFTLTNKGKIRFKVGQTVEFTEDHPNTAVKGDKGVVGTLYPNDHFGIEIGVKIPMGEFTVKGSHLKAVEEGTLKEFYAHETLGIGCGSDEEAERLREATSGIQPVFDKDNPHLDDMRKFGTGDLSEEEKRRFIAEGPFPDED